ncbi:MAG: hypothetical protein JWP00_2842 [Chloroflexi bacterium]|jgi:ABC-2 type transport system permease protein|nr:hypothetical protein [Chloroflexota bacterium]
MSRSLIKQIGRLLGFLAAPLLVVVIIGLVAVRRFEWYILLGLLVLAICVAVFAATNPEIWQRRLGRQRVSSTISGIVVIVALLGIIVLANVLLQRTNVQFDLTKNKNFTISDSSVKVLETLKQPVTATIFYSQNTQTQQQSASDLLKQYAARTDKLQVQSINAELDPIAVQRYGIKSDPAVVFEMGTRREQVSSVDEQTLTRALLRLETGVTRRVLITTGHQELSTTVAQTGNSLSTAVQALTDNNFTVEVYNTATGTSTPATSTGAAAPAAATPVNLNPNNDILLIAGPRGKFSDEEKTRITTFLRQGGKAMIAYDIAGNQEAAQATNVNDLLADWKVSFSRGVIVEQDPTKRAQQSPTFLVPDITGSGDITGGLQGQNVFVLQATGINKDPASTANLNELLKTSQNSYLKTTIPPQTAEFEQNDVRGPLVVAASIEQPASQPAPAPNATPATTPGTPGATTAAATTAAATATPAAGGAASGQPLNTRIVLLGSPSVISDQVLSQAIGNNTFFINAMNYLNESANNIVITSRTADNVPFTVNSSQSSLTFWFSFLGLPVIILLIGLYAWWKRR